MSSRLLILALFGVAVAVIIFWYSRTDRISPLPSTPIEAGLAVEQPRPDQPATRARLRRVAREERDRLADQIARARALRTDDKSTVGSASPPRPAHESADPALRKFNDRALEELSAVQGYLSECYDTHRKDLPPNLVVFSKLQIVTDPDIGAVISAEALTDEAGKPLPAPFDDCIRDMLQTFALPPLPPTDDSELVLALQLSFRDDD